MGAGAGSEREVIAAAAAALGSSLLVVVAVFRGSSTPLASARDYLTLTKPRIMSLLLVTGAAGIIRMPPPPEPILLETTML